MGSDIGRCTGDHVVEGSKISLPRKAMERPGDPSQPTAAAVATLLGCLARTTRKLHLGDGDKMGAGKVGKGTKMERKTLVKGLL